MQNGRLNREECIRAAHHFHIVLNSSDWPASTSGSDTLARWNCFSRRAMRTAMAGSVMSTGCSVRISRKPSTLPLSNVASTC